MRYIKTFEKLKHRIFGVVGDYVICKETINSDPDLIHFIDTNIGQIWKIDKKFNGNAVNLYIKYKDIPDSIKHQFQDAPSRYDGTEDNSYNVRIMNNEEIVMCSDDRKELETYLAGNKYNL
jgi:nucleoside phosphorylase